MCRWSASWSGSWGAGSGRCAFPDTRRHDRGPYRPARAQAVPHRRRGTVAFFRVARRGARRGADRRDRHRRGAGRPRRAGDHRDDPEMDAAARAGLRAQHRDELFGDGDRHRGRRAARSGADLALAAGARLVLVRDAVLPQLAVAGAAVLLHAAAAVRGAHRQRDRAVAGLAQVDHRPVAAGDGQRLRAGARRGALDPLSAVGSRGVARDVARPDAAHGHPAAMHQAHDAAVDEPVCDPHRGDAAHVGGRRERGDDLDRRYPLGGSAHRAARADVPLSAALVLPLLLPDRARDARARKALPGAVMWTPDQPLVSLKNVHKTFNALTVLKGVSLDVMKGQVICIIGPSGSGKSTLLRCINALVPIDSGSILVEGQEVNDQKLDKLALRRKVGMVFQQYNLFPHKTALENVMMAPVHVLKRDKREVEVQALALIKKVRLEGKESAYPGELSGGQQQRIAIARSLAMNPDVMLFDEVTAALDPETVKGVLVTIRELAEDGMTCMIVTHEMGFAREVANQIYFTDGAIRVDHGPPKEFFASPRDPRTRQFLDQIL